MPRGVKNTPDPPACGAPAATNSSTSGGRAEYACPPAAAIGLALRNLAPKSRSIGERYIETKENTNL